MLYQKTQCHEEQRQKTGILAGQHDTYTFQDQKQQKFYLKHMPWYRRRPTAYCATTVSSHSKFKKKVVQVLNQILFLKFKLRIMFIHV